MQKTNLKMLISKIAMAMLGTVIMAGLALVPAKKVNAERPSQVPAWIEEGYYNDYCYYISGDKTIHLFGNVVNDGNGFSLPSSITNTTPITTIIADDGTILPENCSHLFNSDAFKNTIDIDLHNADSSAVTDMSYMFAGCTMLNNIQFQIYIADSVTTMAHMFEGCAALESLDLRSFCTDSVTDMSYMFAGCAALNSLDLSRFQTYQVTDMSYMFKGCTLLRNIDFGNFFDTYSVTDMSYMFAGCTFLEFDQPSLDAFDTSSVTDMSHMFDGAQFLGKEGPIYLNFNLDKTQNMSYMFKNCNRLIGVEFDRDANNVTDMSYMFSGCTALKSVGLPLSEKIDNMSYMFNECSNLESIDLSRFWTDTSPGSTMQFMFYGCSKLKNISFGPHFKAENVTSMYSMFSGCRSLESLDLSSFNTSSVSDMQEMFHDCSSLKELDLSSFNTSSLNCVKSMFEGCEKLQTIYVNHEWDIQGIASTYGQNMFKNCSSLIGYNGTTYDGSIYTSEPVDDYSYAHIDGGEDNPGYLTLKYAPKAELKADTNSFVFTVYAPILDDDKSYTVTFNKKDYDMDDKVELEDDSFYIPVKMAFAARELADKNDFIVKEDDIVIYRNKISVADYLKKLLTDETYGKLAGEMLRYGAAAQVYFKHNDDSENLANYGVEGYQLNDEAFVNATIPAQTLNASDINNALSSAEVTYGGINMTFTSDFTLMFALKVPDNTTANDYLADSQKFANLKTTLGTYMAAEPSYAADNTKKYIILRFKEIPILKADTAYLTFGETQISLVQYLYQATNSAKVSEELKPLCKALYLYYAAAKDI